MLVQCCVSVADGDTNNVPALGKHLLFATSWKGTVLLYRVYLGLLTKHPDWRTFTDTFNRWRLTAELTLES